MKTRITLGILALILLPVACLLVRSGEIGWAALMAILCIACADTACIKGGER